VTAEIVDGGEAGKSSHRKQWTKTSKWMHDRKRAGQAAAVLHKNLKNDQSAHKDIEVHTRVGQRHPPDHDKRSGTIIGSIWR
jgi:hypothetical protein